MPRVDSRILKVPTCRCCGALSCLLLLLTAGIVQAAGNYGRLEASFTIAGLATDPFDYAVTDVKVQILQPNATTISLPAFFDGGTTWRVRHTPTNTGVYQITGVTLNGSPQTIGGLNPTSWTVSGNPTGPGYVRRDPANASRFITSNGRRYYPFGHDVAWDQTVNVVDAMPKLGTAHENWARIWMNHWDSKNLDWPASGSPLPLGQLNLTVAQKWDSIVTAAEQGGVFMQMVLQHHGQYSLTTDSNWAQNPYSVTNGGFLDIPAQFFTNATAKALTKRKMRYAIARWGYSPAIMAWELFNEVQFTQAAQGGQWNLVGAWHDEMALFIRSQDPYAHLITTSSEVGQPIWNQTDYYQHHDYPSDYITALADPVGVPNGQPVRPIFGGEAGRDNTTFYGQHAPVWAGIMGGQSGAAQPWYWDLMDSQRAYSLMRAGSDFVRRAGIPEQDSLAKSAPKVTTPVVTSLVFAPGGGYANATQDTFTVGDAAPAGIGTLPSFLQGNFHRSMTPNGFTFLVNYPQTGTFSVQIVTIAASGASLQIFLDNVLSNSIAFPSSGLDISTNFTLSINVPAGQHTIKLWNPGQDWLNLGNITLDPYVSIVGAYQIGNTNFAALWLWHRTNIYNTTASATVGGSVPVGGLAPGNYSGTWWDTFAGTAISNFNFTVVDTNPVTLATPNILRSTAFFAGKAAQTTITPPLLTHTLGTNSSALNLPLTITNSGGLPVAYSLSVTGISPVTYTAVNSSQAGGPVFAWRDISGIGTDISGNLTLLAGPKTARDEGIAGPINLGFNFPFFSGAQSPGTFSQVYISPNGFITFSPFAGDRSANTTLPNASAPTNMIAPFWDDFDVATGSSTRAVYVDSDPLAGTFTVQYNNVRFKGATTTVTCQVILKSTGEILMQYRSMAVANACTVGLQNAAANQGPQIAFNQNYLTTNFAIRLTPSRWLDLSANAGLLPRSSADNVNVSLNPAGLGYGTYSATILLQTDDAALPFVSFPVTLNVTPQGTWRQTNFGTSENAGSAADTANPDGDGLINILEYAFNTNPNVANASPLSYTVVGNHLTITFTRVRPAPSDITYLYEVADEVTGSWQSGPAFTTENIVNNGNGTETVTVTDNLLVGSSSAHYLRVRISVP